MFTFETHIRFFQNDQDGVTLKECNVIQIWTVPIIFCLWNQLYGLIDATLVRG